MDTERWSTLSVLLDELIELEPRARTRRLSEIEAVDPPLADELRKSIAADVPLASVVEGLSAGLPGDTWLDRIEVNGHEVRITGLTSNATELIAHLSKQPGFADEARNGLGAGLQ